MQGLIYYIPKAWFLSNFYLKTFKKFNKSFFNPKLLSNHFKNWKSNQIKKTLQALIYYIYIYIYRKSAIYI
jgi:hypothetical protein